MDSLRLDTLAGHLVDWHNRRFWARRITVSHVQSMGYVLVPLLDPAGSAALPVLVDETQAGVGAGGATLRERAMARAQQEAAAPGAAPPAAPAAPEAPTARAADTSTAPPLLKAGFSEDFIPPLRPEAVATFASRHGATHAQPGKGAQVRQVLADSPAAPGLQQRWLLTAQIQQGRSRTRVLVGTGLTPAVLGRRLPNTPALALAALLMAAAVAGGWAWMRAPAAPQTPVAPAAAASAAPLAASAASAVAAAYAASAASAATATVWAVALPASAAPVPSVASAAAPSASVMAAPAVPAVPAASAVTVAAAAPPGPPPDVEPTLGQVQLPSLGPIIDERRRAVAAARAASAASAALVAGPGKTPGQQVAQSLMGAPAFAVSTRLLRTRTESQLVAEAMRALLIGPSTPGMHVEAMKAGEDWRVVGWPYVDRAQAERARAFLASRGMKVEVIAF